MATKFNIIFSGYQPYMVVELWVNQYSKYHRIRELSQFPDDEDRDGPQNVGLLATEPPDMATWSRYSCCIPVHKDDYTT
jgi:hypothetical protein